MRPAFKALPLLVLMVSCGKDPDVVYLQPHGETYIPLKEIILENSLDYDSLDQALLESGIAPYRFYEDLLHLAPESKLAWFRAGVASVRFEGGGALADRALRRLKEIAANDPDTEYLSLLVLLARLTDINGFLAVNLSNIKEATQFIRAAKAFMETWPDWTGPHGATVSSLENMVSKVVSAVEEIDASEARK